MEDKRLIELTDLHFRYQSQLKELEKEEKKVKKLITNLEQESIPFLMEELDIMQVKLSNGATVKRETAIYATFPKEQKAAEAVLQWLEKIDALDVIKRQVIVDFPFSEDDAFKSYCEDLNDLGIEFVVKQDVHVQTLRAVIRRQLAEDENTPDLDLFKSQIIDKATIKRK